MPKVWNDRQSGRHLLVTATLFFCALSLVLPCHGQSASESDLHTLLESHQWFALRDAVGNSNAPLFYRAAIEAASNQIKPAEKHLRAVIRAAPHSEEAYEAHDLLGNLFYRNGLYREAQGELEAAHMEKPDAEDVNNALPLFKALSESPDQRVVAKKHSTIRMLIEKNNMFVPARLEGKEVNYVFDSGAGISVMSKLEAERLGLTVRDVDTKLSEASGMPIKTQIAVVKDVVIGGLHLKNVAFAVLPDTGEPFVEMPLGKRGILGISILLAMETVRWEPEGLFAFGFASGDRDISKANVLFDGAGPITQMTFQKKALEFTLDTGAIDTDLFPPFAKEFPELLKTSGQKELRKLTGMGGSANYDSMLLPSVVFEVGGHEVTLKPAHVMTAHGMNTWSMGNLGLDLLDQAHAITIDFHAMTLRLE